MRIGIFSDSYLPVINGVVTSLVTLKNGLEKCGHEVFVVSNHGKIYEIEYKDNVLFLPGINIKFLFDNKLTNPVQTRALEIIKQMNLDLIHVQTEFGIGLFARTVAKKENIPLVYTYHTTWEDYTHYINPMHSKQIEKMARKLVAVFSRQLSKPADAIITPSSKTKELLKHYGVYQPIHVIPTGVNLNRFKVTQEIKVKAKQIRAEYGVREDELLLVFVGRLGEEKNLELLIDSIEDKDIKFMIVGHGPIFDSLNELIEKKNLQGKVILTNKVPNDQIASYYHAGDAFISASMTETQGLTFIEAMACGLPLFASDKEVLLDLLYEGQNGYYFHSLDELKNKLDQFIGLTQEQRHEFSQQSLELVKPYSDVVFVQSVLSLYEKVLKQNETQDFVVKSIKRGKEAALVEFESDINHITMILNFDDLEELRIVEDRIMSLKEMSMTKEKDLINKRVTKCLAKLTYHDYSYAQMMNYLTELDPDHPILNQEVMKVLTEKGFIDDERYIGELVERYKDKGYGLYRITENLKKYEFDETLVTMVLDRLEHQQDDDLSRQYQKAINTLYKGSKQSVRQKIYEKLVRQGFKASKVNEYLSHQEMDYDELYSCQLDANKLSKKDLTKFELKQKLLAKGYSNSTINEVLKGEKDEN